MADRIDPRTGELVTTHYGWTKPTVAASPDAWGGYINTNYDSLDTTLWNIQAAQGGYLPLTGGTLTGALKATGTLSVDGAAGTYRGLFFETAAAPRWKMYATNTVEGGSNAGSDFVIEADNDAGAFLSTPMTISRASGTATFSSSGGLWVSPTGASNAGLILNKPVSGQINYIQGNTNNSARWQLLLGNTTAESGTSTGSDIGINRFNNSGTYLDTPFAMLRSTGVATFLQPIVNGSDRRMKSNIEPVTDALAIVEKLQGVFYKHEGADRRQVGLVAQDVASALPEVVFAVGEELDAMLGVAYPNIVAVLINAVKELSAKVAALEAK